MLTPLFHLFNIPAQLEHTIAFVVGFSVITALHIVLGELVPKSLSIQKTEKVVLFIAWPLIVFNKPDVSGSLVFKPCRQLDP